MFCSPKISRSFDTSIRFIGIPLLMTVHCRLLMTASFHKPVQNSMPFWVCSLANDPAAGIINFDQDHPAVGFAAAVSYG
jgi:hypothetical protein